MEAGGSNSEAEGEGGSGDGVLRGRGRSAVVGVRIGRAVASLSGVEGLAAATEIVEFWEFNGCAVKALRSCSRIRAWLACWRTS